ncbi:hypothetical protein F5Y15DRAFT_402481 [Xylariaceae sp. FL0016]|nr:hypothetical protein F5Y15DRAFT_402481 [Xylariaceae sp. FL0016]
MRLLLTALTHMTLMNSDLAHLGSCACVTGLTSEYLNKRTDIHTHTHEHRRPQTGNQTLSKLSDFASTASAHAHCGIGGRRRRNRGRASKPHTWHVGRGWEEGDICSRTYSISLASSP